MPTLIGCENRAAAGAILASSEVPSAPAANLANPHGDPASSWQTLSGVTTATARFDGGAGATWRILLLANTNLSPTAIVQWLISDNPDMSDPIYSSGNVVGVADRQSVHVIPAEVAGRYCRARIVNASNPDGRLRVAQAYVGPAIEMRRGLSFQSAFERMAEEELVTTRGGQEYPELRFERRAWNLSFGLVPDAEFAVGRNTLDAVMRIANTGENIAMVPMSTKLATINRDAILGRLKPGPVGFVSTSGRHRTWSGRITERL